MIEVDRIAAHRGDILGAHGVPLVTDRPVVRYGLDKSNLPQEDVAPSAARVARELEIDEAAFRKAAVAAGPRAFVEALVRRAEEAQGAVSQTFADIPGALALPDEIPLAPSRRFAAQLLGRVGPATAEIVEESDGRVQPGDMVGLSGLQARYDERLTGTPGVQVRAVSLKPCPTWPDCPRTGEPDTLASWAARPGRPLRLTLDQDLQRAAEEVLDTPVGENAPASAIVAIRPSSGEILAAANGQDDGMNAATFGQYAPGSTFKIVTALALLRAGVDADQILSCSPTTTVDGKQFKNYDDYPSDRVGEVALTTVIANSCNTALIDERNRLERDDLALAAAALGVGVDHDIGFPAYFGQVPPAASETERAANLIGQGKVLASPWPWRPRRPRLPQDGPSSPGCCEVTDRAAHRGRVRRGRSRRLRPRRCGR